ncbi:Nn.00g078800.m01.CDS01 [Neocucurbitaria sp. VM-36]
MVLRRVEVAHESDSNTEGQPKEQHRIFPVPDPVTSYWLSEPHKYSNLRSTPSLPPACDIAIIGSGMAGVLTAYHILQSSPHNKLPNILLLEARALCSGATARNGGHSKVKTDTLLNLPAPLRASFQAYVLSVIHRLHDIATSESLAAHCEFELRRSFDVFCSPDAAGEMKRMYEEARARGEEWTERVSWVGEGFAEQVTSVKGARGAFSGPAASFWPYKFVTGVLGRLVERYPGALNVQTGTLVKSVVVVDEKGGEEENLIVTDRGDVRAKKVVFATNAWTAGLVESFKESIVPVKGMASPSFHDENGSPTGVDYLNPRPNGSIVVGGGSWLFSADRASWYANYDDATRFSPRVEAHWHQYMQSTFHGWEKSNAEADYVWVGIMGRTPDGLPHVGRVPMEQEQGGDGGDGKGGKARKGQQWVLAGFNGGGMALIATAAEAVAKMVLEDQDFDDVEGEFGLLRGFRTSWERLKGHSETAEETLTRK